ncbi:monocarboxylate transporter 13-like [Patiria miniata]|uniref:Major facilitator superfamily (MFS) profile domain-containing protein n=1 Tax=Patiria miniata TaxID=46514 RepID=A0A914A0H7_PATMI|nr:monocarboxylate transporter 13-like [Patiria miniata]
MDTQQRVTEKLKTLMGLISAKWGCVVTLAAAFIFLTCFGTLYSFGILLIELQEEFGSGASETSWIGSIAIGLHALGTFVSSALVRRFDNRPVAVAGIFLCFGSVIVTSLMPLLEVLYFTFGVVYGVGINFIVISSINLILRYFPTKNCSRATGVALTGSTVGMLIMNQVVHHLIIAWGWRNMLRVVGGILLIVCVPCVSTYSQPSSKNLVLADSVAPPEDEEGESTEKADQEKTIVDEEKQRLKEKEAEAVGEEDGVAKTGRCERLRNIAYPELWFLSIGIMGCCMTLTFYYVSMVSFMTTKGFDRSECSLFMMVLAVSEVVGKVIISAVADSLPFPKIYLFVMASLLGVVVMVVLLFATTLGMMLGLAVVAGLLVMAVFDTLPYSICVEIFGSARGLDTSSVVIIMNGVGLILGSLLGMSVDHTGNYDSAILASIGIYCLSVLLYLAVPVYQRLFAKDRYVMVRNRRKALLLVADGPERTFAPSPLPSPEYIYLDIVSVV